MTIVPFLKDQVFGPEMTRTMGEAFDAACKKLGGDSESTELVKEILAARIIELAQTGVGDPQQLCGRALDANAHCRQCYYCGPF
jgi:hypothetical protein